MQIKSRLSIVDWLSLVNCWRFFCVSLRRGLTPHSMAMKSDEIMGKRIKNGDRLWDGMVVPNHHFTQSNWDRSQKIVVIAWAVHSSWADHGTKLCVLIHLFWTTNVVKLHQFRLLWWYHVMPTSSIYWNSNGGRGCSPAASCVKNFWMISFASLTPRQRMLGKSTTLSIFALSSPNLGEMLQKSSRWRIIH